MAGALGVAWACAAKVAPIEPMWSGLRRSSCQTPASMYGKSGTVRSTPLRNWPRLMEEADMVFL